MRSFYTDQNTKSGSINLHSLLLFINNTTTYDCAGRYEKKKNADKQKLSSLTLPLLLISVFTELFYFTRYG